MKILSSFFLASLFFVSSTFAQGEGSTKTTTTSLSWTAANFDALSDKDKMQFINDVREVIASMSEKSPLFAEQFESTSSWLTMAHALLIQECLAADAPVVATPSSDKKKMIEPVPLFSSPQFDAQLKAERDKEEKDAKDKKVKKEEKAEQDKKEKDKKEEQDKKEKIQNTTMKQLQEKEDQKNSEAQKKIDSQFSFSACLYAGFIVKEKTCKAPVGITKTNILSTVFDTETFKCASSEEAICNPLLFGYEGECGKDDPLAKVSSVSVMQNKGELKKCLNKAKPVCAMKSVHITADCEKKTKNSVYLKKAADVISMNSTMIQNYIQGFDLLCNDDNAAKNRLVYYKENGEPRKNSEAIKNDISKTCKVAKPRLEAVLAQYRQIPGATPVKQSGPREDQTKAKAVK